jgi:crotonobetainyl-CoA:carnitine CoA-transferase CaiB-like acyl-CoA transferase
VELIGAPALAEDPRLQNRSGWARHVDDLIQASSAALVCTSRTRVDACAELGRAGIAAGPCFAPPEVIDDAHVALRKMTVEIDLPPETTLPGSGPVLTPGNPIKFSENPGG